MDRALKLFVVRDSSGATVTGDSGLPLYFSDKMKAKDHKWLVSTATSGHTIGYGPDHHKYRGKGAKV